MGRAPPRGVKNGFSKPILPATALLAQFADDLGLRMKFLTNCAACAAPLTHHDIPTSCLNKGEFAEVKSLIRANLPLAERALGSTHDVTFRLYMNLGEALYFDPRRSRDDVVEAGAILKGAAKASKRTLGEAHPLFRLIKIHLIRARNERAFLDLEARYGEGCLKH